MSWYTDLAEGDEVVRCTVGGRVKGSAVVERVTASSVYVCGQRFSRTTGRGWGQDAISIAEPTAGELREVQRQQRQREAQELVDSLSRCEDPGPALDHLRAAVAAL